MATGKPKYLPGSPQEHIQMCEKHNIPIDMVCEDCDLFICATCTKTDHKEHNWVTEVIAASRRRKGLLQHLKKIKEEDLHEINEKIEKTTVTKIKENENQCESQIKKLQEHCEEIIARLTEIKKRHEQILRDNLTRKNDQMKKLKSTLEKKKERILVILEYMEENNSTMSDYSLIDNNRDMIQLLSDLQLNTDMYMKNCEYSVRHRIGKISDDSLENMIGQLGDLNDITVTETNSFQHTKNAIVSLEAFNEDECYVTDRKSLYITHINKQGEEKNKHAVIVNPFDICVSSNGDVYFNDVISKSIKCLSPSGSVSTVVNTDPLAPTGICHSTDGGLLVILRDTELDPYELESSSKRLVRHLKLTGDVIHEYEYQEDGQSRLFTLPVGVAQNMNNDICVVNWTSETTGNLVIMPPSGHLRSVYQGQNVAKEFFPCDTVCDSQSNILVTDLFNHCIHMLSPQGEILKFLLTEKVTEPTSLSLYKSILWVGNITGFVQVFQYNI